MGHGITRAALFGFFPNIRPNSFGGVELSGRLAWDAARALFETRGETATLFCYDAKGTDERLEGDAQIVARTKTQAIWRAARANAKPRVVLVWHLALLKLVPLLRAPRARVIVFLHGIEAWRAQDAITRRVLPRVTMFLANSQHTYERFLTQNPNLNKIAHCVVPLGADSPMPFAAPPTGASILMVSRLQRGEDYKGHREIIQVWQRVRAQMNLQQIPDAQLWIAGDGNLRGDLEMLAREMDVAKSIRFFGRVSEMQKQELLRECRALAMPSRGEGFGLVYLEAMRAARPCLVSDCDAGRAVVNPPEAGLAVNPNDADALTDALVRLLTPGDEWGQWSRAAHTRYAENFTAAQFQDRLRAALGKVM